MSDLIEFTAQVENVIQRAEKLSEIVPELQGDRIQSDVAKYACILVSSMLEIAVREALCDYCRNTSSQEVQRFVNSRLEHIGGPRAARIGELIGEFSPVWQRKFKSLVTDQERDALGSIVENRNNIAHGRHVSLSLGQVSEYFVSARQVVEHIKTSCS